jgi:deoxyribodipyrimidine photo-lyase
MSKMETINIMWFRRDLRLKDNAALYHALKEGHPVLPIFIFDTEILDQLEDKTDARVSFIHAALQDMQTELLEIGSSLEVLYGKPLDCFKALTKKYTIAEGDVNCDV